jgi:hypothetical protein
MKKEQKVKCITCGKLITAGFPELCYPHFMEWIMIQTNNLKGMQELERYPIKK